MSNESIIDICPPEFGNLTDAEARMLRAAKSGEIAICIEEGGAEINKPENSNRWDAQRNIRAALLVWLCTDKVAVKKVHFKGIRIVGAKITGELDLQFATLAFPLAFFACLVEEEINLLRASLKALYFIGTHTGPIRADGLKTEGDVFLKDGFMARGEVRLLGADRGGNLDCIKGFFENEDGDALYADGLKVKGDVFLMDGFRARG